MDDVEIRMYRADGAAWLVARHGALYRDAEGFDDSFAPLVAAILKDFDAHHDPARERGWIAQDARGRRLGSIFCVAETAHTAKLRLFLLEPEARRQGLGRRLLATCMAFAQDAGYSGMTLWTHQSHVAACALYKAAGWRLIDNRPVHSFGVDLVEQQWDFTF